MKIFIRNGRVYDHHERSFRWGALLVSDGRIADVLWGKDIALPAEIYDQMVDADGGYVMPGLVDVHTHGRCGYDFVTADPSAIAYMAKCYARSGVTTVVPTLASAPIEAWYAAIERLNQCRTTVGGAWLAGVHLEGRYLNPSKRGVHAPDLLASPDARELAGLLERVEGVRHVTYAPEMDKEGTFLAKALELGATVGIGHTAATYAETAEAILGGATVMTHLFNAMPPLHHREGGAVCAGLVEDAFCELICDGMHVSPEMVNLAWKVKGDKIVLITDSMEATGCADGEYSIAGVPVTVQAGRAQTADGVLAGSTLSLWTGVLNACDFADITLGQALYSATYAPALAYGLEGEVGSLEVGKRADVLIVNQRTIERVMCFGQWI